MNPYVFIPYGANGLKLQEEWDIIMKAQKEKIHN